MAYEVFISYSHQDQELCQKLDNHLAILKRTNIITSWYDGKIIPGTNWQPQIMQHLNHAQIILLLISDDFMASDFCYSIEMKQAITRHDANQARVIPIILRPVHWQGAPFEKIQVLPKRGKPVTKWNDLDEAFLDIVNGIRKAINDLAIKSNITKQESLWNIPYERNLFFTGRENVLERLCEVLNTSKAVALSGLGGIGKTQIAVEYAYRNRDDYDAIFWVKAESLDSIKTDFEFIAPLLELPEEHEPKQHLIVEAVKRWFNDHHDWLLIFDNADDLEMVRNFLPSRGKGHLLLTTRAHATGRIAKLIKVEKMKPDEGALFLLNRAKLLDSRTLLEAADESEQDIAREIVQAMDGLPLALDQAGAYIEETGCGLQEYLTLYQAEEAILLKDRGGLVTDDHEPVATTWLLSFQKLEEANKAAAELLRFCAFLAPDAIPEELFAENVTAFGSKLGSSVTYTSQFNEAIRELHKHSLVQRDPNSKTLSIHRLVQVVFKDQMDDETQRLWAERTVRAVSRVFPHPEYTNWDFCNRLFMHAQMCSAHIAQWKLLIHEAATLLNNLGFYLLQRGEYQQVELLHQRALTIHEQLWGTDHPETATSLTYLAYCYKCQGKNKKAEPFYQRALAICERVQLIDDPDTVQSLINLAGLNYNQGRLEEAERLLLRALDICERVLGPDHLKTATSLNGLALVYDGQGKYEQAELQYQRVLAILDRVYRVDHPETATSLYNLASFYERQEKYKEAGPLFQRALTIRERVLGPAHPETVATRENYESLKMRINE